MNKNARSTSSAAGSSHSEHMVKKMGRFNWPFINRMLILAFLLGIIGGAALFYYNAVHDYSINKGFTTIKLDYDPDAGASSFDFQGTRVTIIGGFVKGIQNDRNQVQTLILRALSPLPEIRISANELTSSSSPVLIRLENINPGFYGSQIHQVFNPQRVAPQTLDFSITFKQGQDLVIKPDLPSSADIARYVVLGDSRDGYETFSQMIDQINQLNPVFVIDNGDLVYTGKPNQYRIFDRMISNLTAPLCTTLGNHDIRDNGRPIYTKLYGPPYYSFDYGNQHFIFLDSSPGWTGTPAISIDQYAWLERDLSKSQGKKILVISHIPPHDPRTDLPLKSPSDTISMTGQKKGVVEEALSRINESIQLDHGFKDKQEADQFESLMTRYKVDTVYLSHIHSYAEYLKNGVRYLISGGAGAELLFKDSYFHYLIVQMNNSRNMTMVQLPSPANLYLSRYSATIILFAKALYLENKTAVILFLIGLAALSLLILTRFLSWLFRRAPRLSILLRDIFQFSVRRARELFKRT